MNQAISRNEISSFLELDLSSERVDFEVIEVIEVQEEPSYKRQLIKYSGSEGDEIRAYLFTPKEAKIIGSVLVHHQHAGERHLGKSEVAGIAGDPFQFFCPALAGKGIITLAPDSICFEDRRTQMSGMEPDSDPDNDWLQHFNEMCYRLLNGNTLMKKVIDDSSIAISILSQQKESVSGRIGVLGHSYGGNTAIFQSPFDERISHTCSSGAVCSYKTKIEHQTGIEMAEVIPGFIEKYEITDLLKMICPRKLLIVSADQDPYSRDAKEIYSKVKPAYEDLNIQDSIVCKEFEGGHALNMQRFDFIVNWFVQEFRKPAHVK